MNGIEVGVPVPGSAGRSAGGMPTKLPWRGLEIGQSFLLEAAPVGRSRETSLRTRVWLWSRKLGRGFTARKTEEGLRVWRTS